MPFKPDSIKPLWIVFVAGLVFGCRTSEAPPVVTAETETGTVTIEIVSGDTTETFRIENVAAGSTVESVMRKLNDVPVTIHGSGVTAFVDSIGGKSTSSSEGWTYKVDGEFANRGIGDTTLMPPATITWTYGDASEITGATQ